MNLKSRLKPFTAVAFAALALSTVVAGCSDLKNAQDAACCTEFKAGEDMASVDFGVDASIKGSFSAFATAASDLSAVGTGAIADVTTACQNIALDLGADASDPSVVGATGPKALKAWCALAKAQISLNFGPKGKLAESATAHFKAPTCSASLTATANCQASCDANVECDIKAHPPTCTGGTLTVECSGECTASAKADVACTGSCSGKCSGSCTASGGVKVDCKGKCDGTCTAGVAGGATENGSGIQGDGDCKGSCDGHCDAACKGSASAKVKCDGNCSAEATPLKCEGGKLEGGCSADANCQGSCNASAKAKAECTPPSVSLEAEFTGSADAKLQYETAIASLEVNLPKVLVVLEARGGDFKDALAAAVKTAGDVAGSGKLNAKGAVCGLLIGETIGQASENFGAALAASLDITGAVTLKPE